MQNRVRTLLAVGILALVPLVIAACGDDDDEGAGGGEARQISAILYSREVPYYQGIGDGIRDQADEYGWDLNLNYVEPDPAAEVDAINTALGTGTEGIIAVPIDPEGLIPAAEDALAQDVPFIALGDRMADPEAQTTYVGGDFVDFGRTKAEYIVEELDGKGKVGIIHGIRGISFTEEQKEGYTEVFDEASGIEVVDGPYAGNFTADVGLSATQNLLTANPDLDAIFFDNDDLAIGGIQAVQDRGIRPDEILIVGTDGLATGQTALEAGDLDYTLAQCALDQGREAVRALNEVFETGEVEPEVITPTLSITPDSLDEFKEEHPECLEL